MGVRRSPSRRTHSLLRDSEASLRYLSLRRIRDPIDSGRPGALSKASRAIFHRESAGVDRVVCDGNGRSPCFCVVIFVVFKVRTPEGKLDPGVFLILFFPAAGFGLMVFLTALVSEFVMHDFILPHMALEDLSFREAFKAVWTRIKANKETFFSYSILRLLIPVLVGAALAFICWIILAMVFGVLGMSAAGFDALLDDSSGISGYIRIALEVLFVGLGIGIGVLVAASLGGPLAVWVRCYALEFYSGHYKLLASILHPAVETSIVVQGSSEVG